MKKTFVVLLAGGIAFSSCSKMGPLSADYFKVTPTPLEEVGGKVASTINVTFPEKYLKKNAVVTMTPMLSYEGGQTMAQPTTFQGEKVEGNDITIRYKVGGNQTMRATFDYVPQMLQSDLYMTFEAKVGKKTVEIPNVLIGYGVQATEDLLKQTMASTKAAQAADGYQRIRKQRQEADIKYLISQANIRKDQTEKTSVQDFIKMLREIRLNKETKQLENVEVSAYASPDGKESFNDKLAQKREGTASEFVDKQMKAIDLKAPVDAKYTAEDWAGFQELVAQSNLQDKDLILRVLSMYQDPEEREQQIRNISTVYKELADEILPELRRARLALNYNLIGRSDEQIADAYKTDAKVLSIEELLYGGNVLAANPAEKQGWYAKAAELYPNDVRAYNNLAKVALEEGNLTQAATLLGKAKSIDANNAELNTNLALLSLRQGDITAAENYLAKGSGADAFNEVNGCLCVARGQYAQAAANMKGINSQSAALAQILAKDYASAEKTLSNLPTKDATSTYLSGIIAARQGNETKVYSLLENILSTTYASRAVKDVEFKKYVDALKK